MPGTALSGEGPMTTPPLFVKCTRGVIAERYSVGSADRFMYEIRRPAVVWSMIQFVNICMGERIWVVPSMATLVCDRHCWIGPMHIVLLGSKI